MNRVIELLLKVKVYICRLLRIIIDYLNNEAGKKASYNRSVQMQNILDIVQAELFECLYRGQYHNLNNILTPACIRVEGWDYLDGQARLYYSLSKSSSNVEPFPYAILANMKAKMNKDIYSTCRNIINQYGQYYASIRYPYIYNGLYITDIKDLGIDIEIEVVFNSVI